MSLTRFSFSGVSSYLKCPRQFKFNYIEKVPKPEAVTAQTYLGQAVHSVLADLYKHGDDGILLTVEQMHQLYDNEWKRIKPQLLRVVSPTYTIDDYIRLGREMLETYYERHKPFKEGKVLGLELNLSFSLPGTDHRLVAKVDRLWKRDDGVVEICDYKTGSRLPRPQDPDFFFQMGMYQLAVMENYPQFENIQLAQYILRKDEIVSYTMSDDDLDRLREDIRQTIAIIRQSARVDDFPTRESALCEYCEYFQICPAKKHRELLEQEERDDTADGVDIAVRAKELAEEYLQAYMNKKDAEEKLAQVRAKVEEMADRNDLSRIEGDSGHLSVKPTNAEKFPTKTKDRQAFVELSEICRRLNLDEAFELSPNILMKEIYAKERLTPEQMEQLAKYVMTEKSFTIRPKFNEPSDDTDD